MAIPGSYSRATAIQLYGGAPVEYQIDGYMVKVSASTNQKAVVVTTRNVTKNHYLHWDEVENVLSSNS
jgi:hypothetical protein